MHPDKEKPQTAVGDVITDVADLLNIPVIGSAVDLVEDAFQPKTIDDVVAKLKRRQARLIARKSKLKQKKALSRITEKIDRIDDALEEIASLT